MNAETRELLEKVRSTADFGYVSFESINDTNALGDNALHCVCIWGDLDAVKLLVENGINLDQRGEHGFAPLRVAAEFDFPKIVEFLLSAGADPAALDAPEVFDREAGARHVRSLSEQLEQLEVQVASCRQAASKGEA